MKLLDTAKLGTLRPMTDSDLEMVLEWRNAPNVRKNMYTQQVISLDEHRKWWAGIKGKSSNIYLIFEAEGVPTGLVYFTNIERDHDTAVWGFYTGPSAPKGSGSVLGLCALDHAFGDLVLNKLCAEVLAYNTISLGFHKKIGFQEEDFLKDQKKIDGAFVDVYRLAIFADDWQRKRPQLLEKLSRRA